MSDSVHTSPGVRLAIVVATYVASLVIVASIAFVVVILVAGPHSGLLPHWAEGAVLALGWLAVLIVPFVVAGVVWRRLGRAQSPG